MQLSAIQRQAGKRQGINMRTNRQITWSLSFQEKKKKKLCSNRDTFIIALTTEHNVLHKTPVKSYYYIPLLKGRFCTKMKIRIYTRGVV